MKKTKKARILELFKSAPIIDGWKTITHNDFFKANLAPTVEYRENYCDVIYAKRILEKLGHKVYLGLVFHVQVEKKE